MKLIQKGLVGLAALLAFSAPVEGKERPSKILRCEVSSVYQEMLENGYAQTAPKMKTNEAKEALRQGYCAFGSERFPTWQIGLEVAAEYLQKAGADEVDPFVGIVYFWLGRANEIESAYENRMLSPHSSSEALRQQTSLRDRYKQRAKNFYAAAILNLKRLDHEKKFTQYFNLSKAGWERLR